jgi:hypothetical protein
VLQLGKQIMVLLTPKTWKKYVWSMIYAPADLEAEVVSLFLFI